MITPILALVSVVIAVSSLYVVSRSLAPPSRNEDNAIDPYMCGEKTEPVVRASSPYPWLLLLFASTESVPIVVFVSGGIAVLLLVTAGVFLFIVAFSSIRVKKRSEHG
ncbi:MAG: hypothetical protein OWQ48_05125 [Desulfurococcus sp.]|nr:hypothetical protein [Desulfurococcus sp.]